MNENKSVEGVVEQQPEGKLVDGERTSDLDAALSFTPGPWATADSFYDRGERDNGPRWDVHTPYKATIADVIKEADARLIAAAPALYAALKVITDQMEEFSDAEHVLGCELMIQSAREALASANGQAIIGKGTTTEPKISPASQYESSATPSPVEPVERQGELPDNLYDGAIMLLRSWAACFESPPVDWSQIAANLVTDTRALLRDEVARQEQWLTRSPVAAAENQDSVDEESDTSRSEVVIAKDSSLSADRRLLYECWEMLGSLNLDGRMDLLKRMAESLSTTQAASGLPSTTLPEQGSVPPSSDWISTSASRIETWLFEEGFPITADQRECIFRIICSEALPLPAPSSTPVSGGELEYAPAVLKLWICVRCLSPRLYGSGTECRTCGHHLRETAEYVRADRCPTVAGGEVWNAAMRIANTCLQEHSHTDNPALCVYLALEAARASAVPVAKQSVWDAFQKRVESTLLSEEECEESDYNEGWNDALGEVLWKAIPEFAAQSSEVGEEKENEVRNT